MRDCCGNCKNLRFLGDDRLYPYRCKKEKAGITHSREWLDGKILNGYKCDKYEPWGFTQKEERNE